MKIVQEAQLQEARELQKKCLALHLAPPPVISWHYQLKNSRGELVEEVLGKANSFVRNALNGIAFYAGMVAIARGSTSFGDGLLSTKNTAGTVFSMTTAARSYLRYNYDPYITLGSGSDPESLDSYLSLTCALTAGTSATFSTFNSTTRIMTTTINRSFFNGTEDDVIITEAGVLVTSYSGVCLVIRDVLATPVTVPAENTLFWNYYTEVAYPLPE